MLKPFGKNGGGRSATEGDAGQLTRPVEIFGLSPESPKNIIVSSHYSLLSFFPLTLYHLFHPRKSFANFYFLCIGFLQLVPAISITNGLPTLWGPLALIVLVDLVLMANEDIARHKADRLVNGQEVTILRATGGGGGGGGSGASAGTELGGSVSAAEWLDGTWADVREGDVVRVDSHEAFPADLLLLRSSTGRECWVNTKPLDGETDMKLRLAPKVFESLLMDVDVGTDEGEAAAARALPALLRGKVLCEQPNNKINDTSAEVRLAGVPPALASEDNVLLRGCQLRNTDWILGLVLACGPDSKVGFRQGEPMNPSKPVLSDSVVNLNLLRQALLLVPLCLLGSTVNAIIIGNYDDGQPWYRETEARGFGQWFLNSLSYFLLCYSLIPISFYVTRNIIFSFGRYFMSHDLTMYDEEQDEPARVRTMVLLEQLGQVSHIFSDKTGTLTSNRMEFRRAVFGGVAYGCGDTAISRSLGKANDAPRRAAPLPPYAGTTAATRAFVSFEEAESDASIWDVLSADDADGAALRECLVALAVNHSVMLEQVGDAQIPSASSPDELAFVAAAEHFGLHFEARQTARGVVVLHDKARGERHEVQLLEAIAYSSDRKRMSVVVRLPPALVASIGGGCADRIYCKGADSVLFERLAPVAAAAKGQYGSQEALSDLLGEWAEVALRTLVWAKRELPELDEWRAKYREAFNNPSEVAAYKSGDPCLITELQEQLESGLTLQGATAIEDKLQDGVPEILADLREAGTKIWMLTGDKVGTAKNIACACNILPQEADVLEITTETFPVLADVKTTKLLEVQQTLEASRPMPTRLARLGARLGVRSKLPRLPHEELHKQTAALDGEFPGLLEVRHALIAFQKKLSDQMKSEVSRLTASVNQANDQVAPDGNDVPCMVIDEKGIEYCATVCGEVLTAVSNSCRAVVACRARKDQKAQMLNMIKFGVPGSCCLAIGDGANDVAMIKAGHIGVGIIGKEGMEAVNNSDFAIGQFRFLRGLLLVHGRQNYRRYATFCYFMFYQSSTMVFSLFLYSLLCEASGALLYPYFIFDFFTVFYTPLALIVFSVSDQDVSKEESAHTPHLYSASIQRVYLTSSGFARWLSEAFYLAVLLAYLPAAAYGWPEKTHMGEHEDPAWSALSFTAYNAMVIVVLSRLALEVHSWTVLEVACWTLSILALVVTNLMFSYWYPVPFPTVPDSQWGEFNNILAIMYSQPAFWLCLVLIVFLALAPALILDWLHVDPTSPLRNALKAVASTRAAQALRRRTTEMQEVNEAWLSIPSAKQSAASRPNGEANVGEGGGRSVGGASAADAELGRGSSSKPVEYRPSLRPMSEVPVESKKTSFLRGKRKNKQRGFTFSQNDQSAKHVLGLATNEPKDLKAKHRPGR